MLKQAHLLILVLLGLVQASLILAAPPVPPHVAAEYTTFLPIVYGPPKTNGDDGGNGGDDGGNGGDNDVYYEGDGTFYDSNGTGNCSFDPLPSNMFAAMNREDYADSAMCGAYVEITGPLGSVVVKITDQCPECAKGDIDMSRAAFDKIGKQIDGRVKIRWRVISPELQGPIVYHFKEGSNPWWMAVQIRNHRNPIAKVEYKQANGSYVELPRESYNFFILESNDVSVYDFRVTDIYGNQISDNGVRLIEAGDRAGSAQFPAKP